MLMVLGLFVVLNIILFVSDYFIGDGINDVVFYILINSLIGVGVSKYILLGIGIVLGLIVVFGVLGWILCCCCYYLYYFGYSLLVFLLVLGLVDVSLVFCQIMELVKFQLCDGDLDFVVYYKELLKIIFDLKFNLVYIYGESFEWIYFDNEVFLDLMFELGVLKNEGLDFSYMQQLLGIDYMIVGMVVFQCGILLFVFFEGNVFVFVFSFFLQNICLGDILKNLGYQNYFVQGVNLCFVGKDVFLKLYGFDYLYGLEELKSVVVDLYYCNDWGFYDDIVFDEVWKKFEEFFCLGQ